MGEAVGRRWRIDDTPREAVYIHGRGRIGMKSDGGTTLLDEFCDA